jgi:hypothetical protein
MVYVRGSKMSFVSFVTYELFQNRSSLLKKGLQEECDAPASPFLREIIASKITRPLLFVMPLGRGYSKMLWSEDENLSSPSLHALCA